MSQALSLDPGRDPPELVFLTTFVGEQGIKDKDWIPKAAEAGFHLVLTADQGLRKRGDKLPELCEKYGIKHILVTETLKQKGLEAMTLAILGTWPNIREAIAEKELRFKLRLVSSGKWEVGEHRISLAKAVPPRRERVGGQSS